MHPEFIKWLEKQHYQISFSKASSMAFSWNHMLKLIERHESVIISFYIDNLKTCILK